MSRSIAVYFGVPISPTELRERFENLLHDESQQSREYWLSFKPADAEDQADMLESHGLLPTVLAAVAPPSGEGDAAAYRTLLRLSHRMPGLRAVAFLGDLPFLGIWDGAVYALGAERPFFEKHVLTGLQADVHWCDSIPHLGTDARPTGL